MLNRKDYEGKDLRNRWVCLWSEWLREEVIDGNYK